MVRKEDEIMPEYVPLSGGKKEKTIHAALDDEDGSLEEQREGQEKKAWTGKPKMISYEHSSPKP
eukprot:jgi/Pico_ML_1/55945/g1554.t1